MLYLDKIFRHPRMVESTLWRVRLDAVILVKQPVSCLLPHVDYELLEAEALVIDDRGRGVIQRLRDALVPRHLSLPVITIDL